MPEFPERVNAADLETVTPEFAEFMAKIKAASGWAEDGTRHVVDGAACSLDDFYFAILRELPIESLYGGADWAVEHKSGQLPSPAALRAVAAQWQAWNFGEVWGKTGRLPVGTPAGRRWVAESIVGNNLLPQRWIKKPTAM